uniref:Phenylalanine--tRNA ligase beta subunit n=1 Tax=Wildemania schizophylla TaxID=1134705 RepID=A0A126G4A8_WILSC|nr:phenylalanyl-tRNA synthetase beta chain [Wildemania schizophylla]AKS28491.1 phenylalanyl-tRNA synthetase beta chain [Wildemania schizophylla]
MKVSFNWLKELANIETIQADKLASTLTQAGFEVESIESTNMSGQVDYILEISSTANRSDALSMVGLSREVAALTQSQMSEEVYTSSKACLCNTNNIIHDSELLHCISYFGAVIDDIVVKDSPRWLQNRLESSGFVSNNLLLDISNYVMLKWGQPISIIDLKKTINTDGLDCIKICSSFCSEKNSSMEINGVSINLGNDILVTQVNGNITNVAGVEANNQLRVEQGTQSILVEAAIFKQAVVRKSSKTLNIRTESSIRQERGLNIDNWENAYLEAIYLILELAGGNVKKTFLNNKKVPAIVTLDLSLKKVQNILGPITTNGTNTFLNSDSIQNILRSLNFHTIRVSDETITMTIPTYRNQDIYREVDIIEEIARVYGYHNFQSALPPIQFICNLSRRKIFINKCRATLRNIGLTELVHYSLVKSEGEIALNNPLIQDYSTLRCSLLEGLIQSNAYNIKQSSQTIDSFEIGTVFNIANNKIVEKTKLAIIIGGNLDIRSDWSQPAHSLNWYEAKGIIENFFLKVHKKIDWVKAELTDTQIPLIHNKRAAQLIYNKHSIGTFGELKQLTCSKISINAKVFVLEIDLTDLEDSGCPINPLNYRVRSYSKYPSITRDLSVVIPQDMEIQSLFKLLNQFHDHDLEKTTLFDQYKDQSLGHSKKSVGLRFTYRSTGTTLTNVEVDSKQIKLQTQIKEQLKLEVRQ